MTLTEPTVGGTFLDFMGLLGEVVKHHRTTGLPCVYLRPWRGPDLVSARSHEGNVHLTLESGCFELVFIARGAAHDMSLLFPMGRMRRTS